jgi:hypothetical protein
VCRTDKLATSMCQFPANLGASSSWNHKVLSRTVMGLLYIYFTIKTTVFYDVTQCGLIDDYSSTLTEPICSLEMSMYT